MTATWRIGGVLGDRGLDLAEFDAEAADLDLLVDAAEVFEVAVGRGGGPDRRCGTCVRRGTGRARSVAR